MDPQESKRPPILYWEKAPSYSQFLQQHLQTNEPCLISADLVKSWPAFALWVDNHRRDFSPSTAASSSQPINLDYLRDRYGGEIVSVARCWSRTFSDQVRQDCPLQEVIDLWKTGNGQGLYVKDWHLAKSERQTGNPSFYETPQIFQDDWMNAFWEEEGKDDFRFVVRNLGLESEQGLSKAVVYGSSRNVYSSPSRCL